MKILLCTPYLESPDVVSSGIGTWARNIMSYNRETGNTFEIVPVSFDRHTHIEEYTVRGFKRYYSGLWEVGKCLVNALRTIKKEHPDVVHVCTSGYLGFIKDIILTNAARRRGIKSIVHLHFGRLPQIVSKKGFEYRLLRTILCRADMVLTIDQKSFNALSELGYRNIAYIPNPISNYFLQEIKNQEKVVVRQQKSALFAGHVIPTKGVTELVEGCSKVPGLTLSIVGKCSAQMRDRLSRLAEGRDNGNWLTIVGEVPYSDMPGHMLRADIFVFPSYTEAFPNVILEAMAGRCAIASSNVGAIPEMLEYEGESTGICYAPGSADAVADAINTLYEDDTLRNNLTEKAREKVIGNYTLQKIWPQLTNLWGM